ncbi:MAG: protocatechuate 3,4-dioxygenase subunit alpha [Gammaproteobacteria bacterium]|nr:protocatechuate 3,4-dioxygenase subunit alpha [Gammaproteobacteria bacterium]
MSGQTPSQTIGPFFAFGLTPESYGKNGLAGNVLTDPSAKGEHIRIEGQLLDGAGQPVNDGLIEVWQANTEGRYNHPEDDREDVLLEENFKGFGRAATDENGGFWFETIKPGRVPGRGNSLQAPHINVIVFARGMLLHAYTRLYFSDEADANVIDVVLSSVKQSRRGTLIAEREEREAGAIYRFDIHLQGDAETVFFDA